MKIISEALESIGFTVPPESRFTSDKIDKVIGYSYWRESGRFTVDGKKWTLILNAFAS